MVEAINRIDVNNTIFTTNQIIPLNFFFFFFSIFFVVLSHNGINWNTIILFRCFRISKWKNSIFLFLTKLLTSFREKCCLMIAAAAVNNPTLTTLVNLWFIYSFRFTIRIVMNKNRFDGEREKKENKIQNAKKNRQCARTTIDIRSMNVRIFYFSRLRLFFFADLILWVLGLWLLLPIIIYYSCY